MRFRTHRPCNDYIYPSKLNKDKVHSWILSLSCHHCDIIPRTFLGVVSSGATRGLSWGTRQCHAGVSFDKASFPTGYETLMSWTWPDHACQSQSHGVGSGTISFSWRVTVCGIFFGSWMIVFIWLKWGIAKALILPFMCDIWDNHTHKQQTETQLSSDPGALWKSGVQQRTN